MIIIAGYVITDASDRDAAVAAHVPMFERGREHDGCLDLAISADPVDPERINIFERRRDQGSLDTWRGVADPPDVEHRQARVDLFRTDRAESPF